MVYEEYSLYSVREDVTDRLKKQSYSIGKAVSYALGDEKISGVVTDIKNTGAAEITLADGSKREIFCGEIT